MYSMYPQYGVTLEHRKDTKSEQNWFGSGNMRMDGSIWENLPDDLVDMILARLPIPSFFRARMVCKRWESVIRSLSFLKLCSKVPPRLPWYLGFQGFRHEQGWAYDPSSDRWYNLNFSFLPPGRCITAAGGLLCFCYDNVEANMLYICNPMTKAWRSLPPLPGQIRQVVMSMDHETKAYIVIVLVQSDLKGPHSCNSVSALLYDKSSNTWILTGSLPFQSQLSVVDATFCHGVLYCLTRCLTRDWQYIRAYDLRQNMWSDFSIPMPNVFKCMDLMQMAYLVEHNGKLLLVAKIIPNPESYDASKVSLEAANSAMDTTPIKQAIKAMVWIHELDLSMREWRNVGMMHNTILCIGSFTSRAIHYEGSEKLIYFTNHGSSVNMYNVTQNSWHRLPEFPRERVFTSSLTSDILRRPRGRLGLVIPFKGLWFEPRLDCIV